jgi:RNA polymerase sigma-70 factor (ECF subfamily)
VIPLPSDAELAAQTRRGDPAALAALYERHAAVVMSAAYRLTGSAHDAEDVLHDVFLGLPEALHRYEERGALAAWLRRLAVRVALNRMRAERRRAEVPLDAAPEPALQSEADAIAAAAALRGALATLPNTLRAAFVLKEIEGYSHAEIAALLEISVAASETRLSRAVKALHRLLRNTQ